ncbi:hypothetical protein SFRURICE_014720 [Spodoptera frugiperda]|uniref:SFRICE_020871 n=1 Tax=Spodoptera frugiperda TaxID=7108 RepID=A0A2H1WHG3_SPOFR|nr:hypothetical protein SFRURICE_014720 [Spodoptera frugiperda]
MPINASKSASTIQAIQGALRVLTALQLTSYQFPEQTCVFDGASYDYIIVGAGTTGCVVANRLTEDSNTTVLLIEAGGDPQVEAGLPLLLPYLKQSDSSWNYTTEPDGVSSQCHKQYKDDMSIGRVLGGSSSSSYLLYSVGNHYDYDNWAEIVNDSTWKWENVLPYLKKSQRLEEPSIINSPQGEFFGTEGNVGLTLSLTNKRDKYFTVFEEMGNQIQVAFSGNNSLGYSDGLFTISDGIRQSTAISYLAPIRNRPNLHVLKNTVVKKIIFDAFNNAVGVEAYTYDKRYIIVKSRKEVIVSAGIVNSPKLLMLSGVGPRSHLYSHKIATISDLPVGKNLQDHLAVTILFNMTNLIYPYRPYNPHKYPASVVTGYVSLNESSNYPDYQTINFVSQPSYLMSYCTFTYSQTDEICNSMIGTGVNSEMMFSIVNKQLYKSRGEILLKSRDFMEDPYIYTNYYTEEEDLDDYARIVEDFMKILDTEMFQKIGGTFQDPKLPECRNYTVGSRDYWKCYIRCMTTSEHHYSSTCAMGSVVDSRLRVYGVRRLRVADASVMPYPTAGGTLGAAIMIGEKVSDMIKEDNQGKKRYCC